MAIGHPWIGRSGRSVTGRAVTGRTETGRAKTGRTKNGRIATGRTQHNTTQPANEQKGACDVDDQIAYAIYFAPFQWPPYTSVC